ncbi:MAG: MFS transporter [Oscillospiraceae bacterium]|nr:MFS transporter [Oscillospiraceae bacterium]
MVAGGGCKLALSIATNVTVLCMLYGCMTQFGLGVNQGELLSGLKANDSTKVITNLQISDDNQMLALTFDAPVLEEQPEEEDKPYKVSSTAKITDIQVTTAGALLEEQADASLKVTKPVQMIAWYIDPDGNPGALEVDAAGMPVGLQIDENGAISGLNVNESVRIFGLLVNEEGQLMGTDKEVMSLSIDDQGYLQGVETENAVQLASRNSYDSLYLIMMVMGYVFSAPFFLLTVRTSQKHGQKRSLMTYVTVAILCYIGVLVTLLLWKHGNPAWNLTIFEGTIFKPDFKITINLYTILFVLFFGVGYGAYYSTADMPIPMVADCADYETYRSGKFIPGIMGTLFSLVDKLVSSLSATVVSIALLFIGVDDLPTKATPYVDGMNWVVIALFCIIPMVAWILTLVAMKGYELDGKRVKTINAVNAARKAAIANGMTMEEAMATITDETVAQ